MKLIRSAAIAFLFLPVLSAQQPAPSPTPDSYSEEARERTEESKRNAHDEGDATKQTEPSDAEKKKPWDVNVPPGPSHQAKIEVDEGTWMNLDVSPRGDEIVFDLLGDLYVIPIAGGEAKALSSGLAWDEQPRYSPDGRFIAFTSDRAGGDNIWVINRDGSNPTQVTKESFRLLNSPAWSSDSNFIAARKHFTSTRSAGAGEIWLYHRTGSEGLQMTQRPNEQKDLGEPAFSPDNRYLYYSQDTTPGPTFEYNKDPNGQIYVIQRFDRQSGEIIPFINGPGGAIRPTPAPDGKQIAFIRRIRTKSVLHVADVASGAERPIFDGLDRDMQETWAIHGVYPGMAWTPDSRSIVFWSGGKIRRIDVASKNVTTIPFKVSATRTVTESLRFPVEVAPERLVVKMLRWVEVAPKGDRVVYSALGYIYVRDLPNGTPRRLTTQRDHYEYYPSFSRDGQSIVYTTWDDKQFGSVRIAPSRGGEGRAITRVPGHYLEPSFSPDGNAVVFRKVEGGYLRAPEWSRDPGIYMVPARGGEATKVVGSGLPPHFGADNDRVYFISIEPEDKRALKSVKLSGADIRTHLLSEAVTEFKVSPDGKWIAFTEGFNAHIAPLVATGRAIDIGPQVKSLPVRRVSRDAGDWIHWSGDSTKLYWSLGPELFSRRIADAFSFVEGAPRELPEAPATGINIGFDIPADVPSETIALVGGRVLTMRGDEIIEDGAVVVQRNRITAVGPRAQVAVPAGAKVIDTSGKTIMPGLIDVHWHGAMGTDEIIPQQSWINYASLAFGVTTIHDPSNDTSEIFTASEMHRAGEIVGPRIFSTGTILYGAKAPMKATIDSLEDARSHLRRMKAVGAFSVKSYNQPRREQRQQVIQAARELQMMVVPEGGSLLPHNLNMIADGHTGIEHAIPVGQIYNDVVQLWSQSNTYYTPTLIVGYGGLWGENYWYQKTNVWEDPRLMAFTPREVIDQRSRRRVMAPDDEFNHINNARVAKRLNDAGVSLQIGGHGQRNGLDAHWETWMMVQGGMSPMQALHVATINGARYLGLDRDIGSLEAGKLADLIVLDASPLENIRNTEAIRHTMVNGRLYEAMTMDEIGNGARKREPFFWQK